jgi:hypothetical protein
VSGATYIHKARSGFADGWREPSLRRPIRHLIAPSADDRKSLHLPSPVILSAVRLPMSAIPTFGQLSPLALGKSVGRSAIARPISEHDVG